MSTINREEVRAFEIEGEGTVCKGCATEEEQANADLDTIITEKTIEYDDDNMLFCDRCKERIQ